MRRRHPTLEPPLAPIPLLQGPSTHLLKNVLHLAQTVPVPRRHVHARFEEAFRGDQISRIFRAYGFLQDTPHTHVHLVVNGRFAGTVWRVV